MSANVEDRHDPIPDDAAADWTLRRWHVSFRSGSGWYPVGEFVALTAAAAIERAVEVFGPGAEYQADEIPWDAAPLPRVKPPAKRCAEGPGE
jgi:hypothetical protein